jgi:polyisoprenoid-binding protein YceI
MVTAMSTRSRILIAALVIVFAGRGLIAEQQTFRVDPANSATKIHVGKAGMFSFMAGHTHEVAGPIQSGEVVVDPEAPAGARIRLTIATSELEVSAASEPTGDAPKVQEAMAGPKVLDAAQHPRITYESTSVTSKEQRGNQLDLVVSGKLTIRGVTQPVTVPVHAVLADTTLTASGRFKIKQSAFGITPISVGGVVAVKDELEIEFSIAARK